MAIERKVILESLDEVLIEGLGDILRRSVSAVKDAAFPKIPTRLHPRRTLPSATQELNAAWQALIETTWTASLEHDKPPEEQMPGEYYGYYYDSIDKNKLLLKMIIKQNRVMDNNRKTISCQYILISNGHKYRHRIDGPAYIQFDITIKPSQLAVTQERWFAYGQEVAEQTAPEGSLSIVDDEGGELSMADEQGALSFSGDK